jgi:hypothetical protein
MAQPSAASAPDARYNGGMRPKQLWAPPRATPEQHEFVGEVLASCGLDVCRISSLVKDQLADDHAARGSHIQGIIDAIKRSEGLASTNAKPPTMFDYSPLKGLWHQHYLSAGFLPHNLYDEMLGMGDEAERRMGEVLADATLSEEQKANVLAYDFTVGLHQTRNQEKRMTGEWVVFAKDSAGTNYYLAAAFHAKTKGNRALVRLIRARCEPHFVALLPRR